MNAIFAILAILSSCCGYDGSQENKHYFHLSTPKADYGFVLDESGVSCDTVWVRK